MSQIKHILVPTDGSEGSLKAARFAGDLARALDARTSILLVHDERSIVAEAWGATLGVTDGGPDGGASGQARGSIEQHALDHPLADTRNALGDVAAGADVVQIWGHPASSVCDYAKQHEVDMIVMGSHGRSALGRAILGSVSHAVVNGATCAVTVVR